MNRFLGVGWIWLIGYLAIQSVGAQTGMSISPPAVYVPVDVPARSWLSMMLPINPCFSFVSDRALTELDRILVWDDSSGLFRDLTPENLISGAIELGDRIWIWNGGETSLRMSWAGMVADSGEMTDDSGFADSFIEGNFPRWPYRSDGTESRIRGLQEAGDGVKLVLYASDERDERVQLFFKNWTDEDDVDFTAGWFFVAETVVSPTGTVFFCPGLPAERDRTDGGFILVESAEQDPDQDGLSSAWEILISRTDAWRADTDGDGIPDGWETQRRLDPTTRDGHLDTDGDGFSNGEEYLRGTDPNDHTSSRVTWYVDNQSGDDRFDGRWATVKSSGEGPFRKINSALSNAIKGDRVVVAGGNYDEDVDISGLDLEWIMTGDIVLGTKMTTEVQSP